MKVKIDKSFEKDTDKINDVDLLHKIATVIEHCINANSLQDIQHFKKLSGYKSFFRIKIGYYRIGLKLENDELIFERILHRKDIYKKFP